MSAEQQEFAIELSQLREQIKFVASDIGDIKTAISQIVTLDKTLAELTIHNQTAQKNMDTLWTKYDELKTKTTTMDHEVKSFVNRLRGGALLRGLADRLHKKTGLPVFVAEDPLRAVVRGTGIALKNMDKFNFLIK